jgi:hypothetical protein
MRAYLWTMLILLVLEAVGRVLWIARDDYPRRTRLATVIDLVVGLVLAAWVAHLLLTEVPHG